MEIKGMLRPLWESGSMGSSVIRLKNRGRLDFWTLGNEIAGRSRRYRRVVIDEAAFAKNGDNKVDGSMMEIWEKAIKPTLFDYGGEVLICSNSAGKNPDNFFYNICTDTNYGFGEFHATTMDNPKLPKPDAGETKAQWSERRRQFIAELIRDNDPLVYQQEYLAEFVDWAGVAFFGREKKMKFLIKLRNRKHSDAGTSQPWVETVYWDCIFVGNHYKSGPIKGVNLPAPAGYVAATKEIYNYVRTINEKVGHASQVRNVQAMSWLASAASVQPVSSEYSKIGCGRPIR